MHRGSHCPRSRGPCGRLRREATPSAERRAASGTSPAATGSDPHPSVRRRDCRNRGSRLGMMSTTEELAAEYQRRLADRRARAAHLAKLERRVGTWRLAIFGVGAILAWLAFISAVLPPWLLAVPAVAFVALVLAH